MLVSASWMILHGMDSSSDSDESLSSRSECSIVSDSLDIESQQPLSVMSQRIQSASVQQTHLQKLMHIYEHHMSKYSTKILSITTACVVVLVGGTLFYLQYQHESS